MHERLPNVLVLSRAYPNSVLMHQGPWVQRQMVALRRRGCRITVVAPSPYWPPVPWPHDFARLRSVERYRHDGDIEVFHPRFLVGPGQSTYALEAAASYAAVRRLVIRLHTQSPFDIIHAHFSYPDAVAAIAIGQRLRTPVVVTEHVLWKPWMDDHPSARHQAVWALSKAKARVAVSDAVKRTMMTSLRDGMSIEVIPVGVDGDVFPLKPQRSKDGEERLLFVGWINYIKGIDVLFESLALLAPRRPHIRLTVVGGALFRDARRQQKELIRKVQALGLEPYVTFAGPQSAEGVARFMRRSDLVVLPSRRESCGSVLLESLASGTPVVATKSGGPEEIVTPDVGELVPVDDPAALAAGIERVLDGQTDYVPARLREYVLSRFSWDRLAEQYLGVYLALSPSHDEVASEDA